MSSFAQILKLPKESVFGAITDRTLAGLRLVLAISALLIVSVDPTETNRLPNLTQYALSAYILYSAAIYLVSRRTENFSWTVLQCITWTDVLWYSVLISFNNVTNAVFFFFYLFAIIAGSSRGGTRLGLSLTVVSMGLFVVINVMLAVELQLDFPRFMRRAVYMGALGGILSYWGGAESALKRKLAFLKELSSVSNPRFGVDRTIKQMLQRLLDFYQADYCFFLLRVSEHEPDLDFYRVAKEDPHHDSKPLRLSELSDIPLMKGLDSVTAVYSDRDGLWTDKPSYRIYDSQAHQGVAATADAAKDVAEFLNVRSFITAPLRYRQRIRGRILVGSARSAGFEMEDAAFLEQAADQGLPVIENIRLVDRLAADAAEEERRKIARSVHDRVIQPYLGLQIGLKALQQELQPLRSKQTNGNGTGAGIQILDQLISMTRDGIEELRQYVHSLKRANDSSLVESLRRFAGQFENATGIHVDIVDGSCDLKMNDRVSAEIFQMTAEALSNVQRHTQARSAQITLAVERNSLELTVENEAEGNRKPFRPVSICERAEALGARLEVCCPPGRTQLKVEVPL